jgi:hypothetical protein
MKKSLSLAFLLALTGNALAIGQARYVTSAPEKGSFRIADRDGTAALYVDLGDWPGVIRAAKDLQADIARVTNRQVTFVENKASLSKNVIIIGTVGKGTIIDTLGKAGKIDVRPIARKWESFFLEVVQNPLPNVSQALVIAGSDKRGTIFGIYDLCEQIGVSPWYWWADVPAVHQDSLFVKAGVYRQGPPSVKYRGIFLNDEAPDLTNWVQEKFGTIPPQADPPIPPGVANYNSEFYARIFEVILRLKGNYLWPAMWNNAFNEDDPRNPKLADEYGIVMGSSHQEPMLRAQKEWDRRYQKTLGSWNYYKYPDVLQKFWRDGLQRNKNYESIITIGLRGADDTPMIPGGTVPQSMALLEEIVGVQRKIIAEEINPEVTKVPQLWCLYKEVQEYYQAGLRVPDDVTLLWADDNWGDVRRLPTETERGRGGGAGVYYHFDYVGGPRNYKWINTNPISKVWEQMSLAKAYGADRIWIVNVGHFKGLEFPIEYFMHLGWDTGRWTNSNISEYTKLWARREFGPRFAEDIADIITGYTRYNGRRKPELLEPTTYSLTNYGEAETVVADFNALAAKAEQVRRELPENVRDAFYELVLFPTKACAQVNELYVAAGKNALYAQQGRASANDQAAKVEALFRADADLMDYFNHVFAGGKWNHFMDQVHIGYTIWQDPPANIMPQVTRLEVPETGSLGVAIEGSTGAWPGSSDDAVLPEIDTFNRQSRFVELFNRGRSPFQYRATASEPWLIVSQLQGTISSQDERVTVSVDWAKAPKGEATGTVKFAQDGGHSVTVKVRAFSPTWRPSKSFRGFVEADGYVSIEAEHYTKKLPSLRRSLDLPRKAHSGAGSVQSPRWDRIDDYGRTLSGMTVLPATAPSVTPPADSPCLEYEMYLFHAGSVKVKSYLGPSLNFMPGRGVRLAVSFDDEPPQILEVLPESFDARNGNREWETSVKDACRIVESSHMLASPGEHTLKIWMVDPGVVLQRIVVDLGGVKPSYLGPPESYLSRNRSN